MLSNLHSNVANREIRTNSMSSNPSPVLLPSTNPPNSLHGKIIMAALAMLCLVVVFTLGLHIYAKFFWRRSTRRLALWRRRQGLEFQGGEEPAQIGLEKAVVDSLPTFVYKLAPAQTETLECAVCLCEFQDNDKGRLLPKCSHSFHTDCIDMWFLSHTTCPLCRTSAEPVGKSEDVFMGSSSAFLLGQSTGNDLQEFEQIGGGTLLSENGDGDANPNGSPLHDDRSFSSSIQQSVGWSWRRSISDRSPQSPGVQFPTNVLFWGDHAHVNSRVSPSPRLEHGQSGGRSLPHIVIEIPRRQQNLLTLRSVSLAPSRCSSTDDQSCPSPTGQQPSKSPGVRFNAFKRLLTKESKIFPAEQDMSSCSGQSGATVSTA